MSWADRSRGCALGAPTATVAEDTVEALGASPYFRGLPDAWLRRLAESASRAEFAPGEELAPQLDAPGPPCLYLLVRGEARVSALEESSETFEIVAHEGAGSVFGSTRITGEERAHAYHAVTRVETCVWTEPALRALSDELEGFRKRIAIRLSLRRRQAELVELLRDTPLFDRASRSLVRWLVLSATLDRLDAGSVIFRRGEEADAMFLVVSGEIEIALSPQRRASEVEGSSGSRRMRRGEYFGEIALVEHTT